MPERVRPLFGEALSFFMASRWKRTLQFEHLQRRELFAGAAAEDRILDETPVLVGSPVAGSIAMETGNPKAFSESEPSFVPMSIAGRSEGSFSRWLELHRPYFPESLRSSPTLAESILLAQRSMFLQATSRASVAGTSLLEAIDQVPHEHYWAGSGESIAFLEAAFAELGIGGQFLRIQMWHTATDHSLAIEYYSDAFEKGVFYDPLYGVLLIDRHGVPAGVHEIYSQLATHGRDFDRWDYQPQRIDSLLSYENPAPTDPEYQFFLQRNYNEILRYYTYLLTFAEHTHTAASGETGTHTTVLQAFDPGSAESSTTMMEYALAYFSGSEHDQFTASVFRGEIRAGVPGEAPANDPTDRLGMLMIAVEESLSQADRRSALEAWIGEYLSAQERESIDDPVRQVLLAFRRMARSADRYEVSGEQLFERIMEDPRYRGWGHAGASVEFLLAALEVLHVQAYRLSLWHTVSDSHMLLGYYDADRILQLVDPLYGRTFMDSRGNSVGLAFLLGEISKLGRTAGALNLFTQRIDPLESADTLASSPDYQYFIARDWTPQMHFYVNLLTVQERFGNGSSVPVRDNWWVLEQVTLTRSPDDGAKHRLLAHFAQLHGTTPQGSRGLAWLNRYVPGEFSRDPAFTQERLEQTAAALAEKLRPRDPAERNEPWIDQWLEANSPAETAAEHTMAERILAALHQMYLSAVNNERDLDTDLIAFLQSNPQGALWAHCGSTVQFLMRVFEHYGIASRRIQMWHDLNDHHVAIEYYSEAAGKFVFYDPLYATLLLSAEGLPASFEEIFAEAQRAGTRFDQWLLRPVSWEGGNASDPVDPRVHDFFSADYSRILRYYLNITAVELETTTFGAQPPGWNPEAAGSWSVVVRPDYSDLLELPAADTILARFRATYAVANQGRFYLAEQTPLPHTVDIPLPSFPAGLWSLFQEQLAASGQRLESDLTRVRLWLANYRPAWMGDHSFSTADAFVITFASLVSHRPSLAQNAFQEFVRSLRDDSIADQVIGLTPPEQLKWGLGIMGVHARRVILGQGTSDGQALIEYVSPGARRPVVIHLLAGQMYVDQQGTAAGGLDLRIELANASAENRTPRFMPLHLSMLDTQQRENSWLVAPLRRLAPKQIEALRGVIQWNLMEIGPGIDPANQRLWTARYSGTIPGTPAEQSSWLVDQGRRAIARAFGNATAAETVIAPSLGL